MKKILLLLLSFVIAYPLYAQSPKVHNLYDIVLNGTEVTVDGDLADWQDASWFFMSQDRPSYDTTGTGHPSSPNDFSGSIALKMDSQNLYVAVKIRDEGTPMIETFATPNLAWQWDHIAVYAGLFDMGPNAFSSPHVEGAPEGLEFYDPVTGDTVETARTYRIAPGVDNMSSTLGPDYQLTLRNLPYPEGSIDDQVQTYNHALVDTLIPNTEAVGLLSDDEKTYIIEWKIPFASLAGKIAKPSGPFANFEWPLFTPSHGMIIPFDAEFTDRDEGDDSNRWLRMSNNGAALWRDSKDQGMRGRIVDLSQNPNDVPRTSYYIDYVEEADVTIDGSLEEWMEIPFIGLSQDSPLFTIIQGTPAGPADFSAYYAMRMDKDHVYFAINVRDEGVPMVETFDTPNLAFNYDHLSAYLGLYDIGDGASSPHLEGSAEGLEFYDPVSQDTIAGTRTYRIAPDLDNMESTLGADHQLLLRALPYEPETFGAEVQTYNGAYVDTTIQGTEAGGRIWDQETGYSLEWKVPFSSLAGNISKPSREFKNFEWELFEPVDGKVIVFDADITDRDDEGSRIQNRYLRIGDLPALWRDSKSFKMRGKITATEFLTSIGEDEGALDNELPSTIELKQNYPNPFNPSTVIEYTLNARTNVSLTVYNLLGQEVAVLINQAMPAGSHQSFFDASALGSGVYFYRLQAGNTVLTKKMTLIK